MKRIAALILLAIVSVSCSVPSYGRDSYDYKHQTRASRKAARKQQKAANKYSKQQQKAMKKSAKAQRKALKRARKHSVL
jgi:hypothetical protein